MYYHIVVYPATVWF